MKEKAEFEAKMNSSAKMLEAINDDLTRQLDRVKHLQNEYDDVSITQCCVMNWSLNITDQKWLFEDARSSLCDECFSSNGLASKKIMNITLVLDRLCIKYA